MMYRYRTGRSSLAGTIFFLLIFAAILVAMYYLFRMFYWLAALAMPVLLIATLIINYRVITNFFKMIWALLKSRPILGMVAVVFTALLMPLVVVILFVQALFLRKVAKAQQKADVRRHGEWANYEVIDEQQEHTNVIGTTENADFANNQKTATTKESNKSHHLRDDRFV